MYMHMKLFSSSNFLLAEVTLFCILFYIKICENCKEILARIIGIEMLYVTAVLRRLRRNSGVLYLILSFFISRQYKDRHMLQSSYRMNSSSITSIFMRIAGILQTITFITTLKFFTSVNGHTHFERNGLFKTNFRRDWFFTYLLQKKMIILQNYK